MEDTIAAISTASGPAAIAIVRISGPQALAVADAVFCSPHGAPSTFPSHTIHYGSIGRNGDLVDHVMLSVMHAPRTYTGEHTVEINCHGGTITARKILAVCLQNGARLAEPGEFTKQAFLNGKLDLTQAEAVMDLISAKSDRAQSAAAHAIEGHLARRIKQIRETLIEALAHLEAHIDFPEEDVAPETLADIKTKLEDAAIGIRNLLRTAREGRILREGFRVSIVGRPNSGKSSLLNALLGEERAIVTPIAGTTRDTLEESAVIGGLPIILTDTAGFRNASGYIERLGVERSRKSVARADLVLHVIDASKPASKADREIARHYHGRPVILVLNKSDLPRRMKIPVELRHLPSTTISCLTGAGLDDLRHAIEDAALKQSDSDPLPDAVVNDRHESELKQADYKLTEAINGISRFSNIDITAQTIRTAVEHINYVTGTNVTEDVLNKIFSTFCIGK